MMRPYDDPDQAVSLVAILFFVGAAFLLLPLLGSLGRLGPFGLILLALGAAQVVAAVGLLKTKRWAWPLGVGAASLGAAVALLQFTVSILSGLFELLFAAITLYLLFRPSVRERFGLLR
jgi:hypothetical protein